MGFFTDLLADVDKKAQAEAAAKARPQKRKLSSAAADGRTAKTLKDDFSAASIELSTCYSIPYDIHPNYLIAQANRHCRTPTTYRDGPRDGAALSPLIPYDTHAAVLKGKLNGVLVELSRLEDQYEDAVTVREKAKNQLMLHERGQRRFLAERSERDGMRMWAEVRGAIRKCLADAERKIEEVKREADSRKLRGVGEDDAEVEEMKGWGRGGGDGYNRRW